MRISPLSPYAPAAWPNGIKVRDRSAVIEARYKKERPTDYGGSLIFLGRTSILSTQLSPSRYRTPSKRGKPSVHSSVLRHGRHGTAGASPQGDRKNGRCAIKERISATRITQQESVQPFLRPSGLRQRQERQPAWPSERCRYRWSSQCGLPYRKAGLRAESRIAGVRH